MSFQHWNLILLIWQLCFTERLSDAAAFFYFRHGSENEALFFGRHKVEVVKGVEQIFEVSKTPNSNILFGEQTDLCWSLNQHFLLPFKTDSLFLMMKVLTM